MGIAGYNTAKYFNIGPMGIAKRKTVTIFANMQYRLVMNNVWISDDPCTPNSNNNERKNTYTIHFHIYTVILILRSDGPYYFGQILITINEKYLVNVYLLMSLYHH